MKKITLFALALAILGSVSGCGSEGATEEDKAQLNKIKTEGMNQKLEPGQSAGFRTGPMVHETTEP